MRFFNRLTAVWLAVAMLAPLAPLEARTRKGDKFLAEGRIAEGKKDWDAALASYEKALSEDPAELTYQMAAQKARFQCAQLFQPFKQFQSAGREFHKFLQRRAPIAVDSAMLVIRDLVF